jgi:hypothetical protein
MIKKEDLETREEIEPTGCVKLSVHLRKSKQQMFSSIEWYRMTVIEKISVVDQLMYAFLEELNEK